MRSGSPTAGRSRRIAALAGAMLAALALGLGAAAEARAEQVVVLSGYPDDMSLRYKQAFEKRHPGIEAVMVAAESAEALAIMRAADDGGVDVYWAPHRINFAVLADELRFRSVPFDRNGLPGMVGAQKLSDIPAGIHAFELGAFGVAYNPAYLAARNLPVPASWKALADPAYAGHLLMPMPSKAPFGAGFYDVILQKEGWAAGWSLIIEMAANTPPVGSGAEPTGRIAAGEAGLGPTLDSEALPAVAAGKAVAFRYPEGNAYFAGFAGVSRGAPHAGAAATFIGFLLSTEGQQMLLREAPGRLPVRPAAYPAGTASPHNPFAAGGSFAFDWQLASLREALVAELFDRLVSDRYQYMRSLWARLRAAEAAAAAKGDKQALQALGEARAALTFVPLSEKDAGDRLILTAFRHRHVSAATETRVMGTEANWRRQIEEQRARAAAILERLRP